MGNAKSLSNLYTKRICEIYAGPSWLYRKPTRKTVLENSCGEGDILIEIVRRYITDCRKQGYSDDVIKTGITRDIKAYEIDAQCVLKCIANLTTVAEELGLSDIQWNIEHSDYLESKAADYDFIVGNPPYITYHDLTVETREWLKKVLFLVLGEDSTIIMRLSRRVLLR